MQPELGIAFSPRYLLAEYVCPSDLIAGYIPPVAGDVTVLGRRRRDQSTVVVDGSSVAAVVDPDVS